MKCSADECKKEHSVLKHWLTLRVTAVIAIPLCIWLVFSIVSLIGADHSTFTMWLAQPLNAFEMSLFVIVIFVHAALGCHEIIEDYIQNECLRKLKILGINVFFMLAGAVSLASIINVAFRDGL
ncbi:MAG: succinate dehydrogenase, hydrophobic membrane anchor protein [Alphaproteobacteria bacterium]